MGKGDRPLSPAPRGECAVSYTHLDEEYQLVRTKRFFVKVMTPEEAILQMNLLGHEFFMFRDDVSGEINVVSVSYTHLIRSV